MHRYVFTFEGVQVKKVKTKFGRIGDRGSLFATKIR